MLYEVYNALFLFLLWPKILCHVTKKDSKTLGQSLSVPDMEILLKVKFYFLKRALQGWKILKHYCPNSPTGDWHNFQNLYESTVDIPSSIGTTENLGSSDRDDYLCVCLDIWRWAESGRKTSSQKVEGPNLVIPIKRSYLVQCM